jgi:hypothetical protein
MTAGMRRIPRFAEFLQSPQQKNRAGRSRPEYALGD